MNKKIGIRYEDRFKMERRVAIIPKHVKQLSTKNGLEFFVERSSKRVFTDTEFTDAGARLVDDVRVAPVIFGVKEMPLDYFEEKKTYVFFSHTIKGQSYNIPALKKMIEKNVNLIDYEKVADESGKRLIFFGRFAGLAGMINSLWALGLRLKEQGINTPFLKINQSHTYDVLEEAEEAISEVGSAIRKDGLAEIDGPVVIGFTGYGNVSSGAQEIIDLLPLVELSPEELLQLYSGKDYRSDVIYKVVFKEEHIARPIDPANRFELQDYYHHPEKYESDFGQYCDKLTVLMNCMYWDKRYPMLITKAYLKENYGSNHPLKVIGDITCDPNGSIECTLNCTEIEAPNFVYNPRTESIRNGYQGEGILIMAVDILPSELPRESSKGFSSALLPFIASIVEADYSKSFEELDLPKPIKRALILHKGEFTPDFKYMEEYVRN